MAINVRYDPQEYMGLSTDTKPINGVNAGSTFYETDSKNVYIFNGASWVLM